MSRGMFKFIILKISE